MNKAELVSHVAAETSTTMAAADRVLDAVLSAIADALARDEPVAIAGFGTFTVRGRAARQRRNPQTGQPVALPASKVPSRSSQRKSFETRSTNNMMEQATTCSPSVSATLPPPVRTFQVQIYKASFLASRRCPMRFPSWAIPPQSIYTRLVRKRCSRKETCGFPRSPACVNTCAVTRNHQVLFEGDGYEQ